MNKLRLRNRKNYITDLQIKKALIKNKDKIILEVLKTCRHIYITTFLNKKKFLFKNSTIKMPKSIDNIKQYKSNHALLLGDAFIKNMNIWKETNNFDLNKNHFIWNLKGSNCSGSLLVLCKYIQKYYS